MIDRLEELLDRSTRIPATSRVIIDEDEYLRLIDQMRISVPAEIKNAREVEQERDAILEAAQAQGNAMVEAAREKADRLAAEHEIAAQAEERAERIVAHAREVADQIRADADGYALEVLENIAAQIDSFSRTVSAGIAYVQQRHPSLRGQGQAMVQPEVLGGAEEGATAGSPR